MIGGAMVSIASRAVRAWGVALIAVGMTSACSSSSPGGTGGNINALLDGGDLDGLPVGVVSCDDDPRVDTYTAHLAKTGVAGLKFEIQSSDPAPPAKGGDTFVLKITDADGQAMTGDLSVDSQIRRPRASFVQCRVYGIAGISIGAVGRNLGAAILGEIDVRDRQPPRRELPSKHGSEQILVGRPIQRIGPDS